MSINAEPPVGSGSKSVNVEINLVPFIDMMSCMVAFLLLSAVWVDLAQIKVHARGRAADAAQPDDKRLALAVLVTHDGHYVGTFDGERRFVPSRAGERDWAGLRQAMGALGAPDQPVEIAAEDGVDYQTIISTMDAASALGHDTIAYVDPGSLTVRFSN